MKNDANLEDGIVKRSSNKTGKHNDRSVMNSDNNLGASPQRSPLAISVSSECTDEYVFIADNASDAPHSQKDRPSEPTGSGDLQHRNQGAKQLLVPPPATTRLQLPSSSLGSPTSSRPPSAGSSARRSTAAGSNNAPSVTSKQPSTSQTSAVLPLGLREVIDNYHKEYLHSLFRIIKLNIIIIIVGCLMAFVGLGMMVYSAISILGHTNHDDAFNDSTGETIHTISNLESLFEKLGAILAGVGAFINMVSVVYILDRRAILERERLEKIDTYKKNRQQPRNIFEILLVNAKQKAAAAKAAITEEASTTQDALDAADVIEPQKASVVAVVVEEEKISSVAPAASKVAPSVKAAETKAETTLVQTTPRQPSDSSSYRPRVGSTSMAKAMAAATSQQLKQFSKTKGGDDNIFVISSQHQALSARPSNATTRPTSRAASVSSSARQQQAMVAEGIQVHRGIEDWLKTSVLHTATNEFATEMERDAASESMSISIASGRNSVNDNSPPSSRSITPEPTLQIIVHPDTAAVPPSSAKGDKVPTIKVKRSHRRLPGTNVPIRSVFRQMVEAQKTSALYDTATDRETPLPPPTRVSAHYARRQQPLIMQQQQNSEMATRTMLHPLDSSRIRSAKPRQQSSHDSLQVADAMWATSTPEKIHQTNVRQGTMLTITDASMDDKLPPLPPTQSAYIGASSNSNINNQSEKRGSILKK